VGLILSSVQSCLLLDVFRKNDWKNSLVSVFETPACCVCCRPFREFDLANNRRLDPTATFHFRGG
jgi:hypothetical protein